METILSQLKPYEGSKKKRKRVGRGPGSGHGKTSCRGTKGQKARGSVHPRFEGGQTPLHIRVPTRGFVNIFKREYVICNVKDLNVFNENEIVDPEKLREKGIIKKKKLPLKILGEGELNKPLVVKANKFSKTAISKIEKAGGKVIIL